MRDWHEDTEEEEEDEEVPHQHFHKAEDLPEEEGEGEQPYEGEDQAYPEEQLDEVAATTGEEPVVESPAIIGEEGATGVVQGEQRQERRRYDDAERGGRGGYRGRGGFRGNFRGGEYRGGYQKSFRGGQKWEDRNLKVKKALLTIKTPTTRTM